MVFSLFYKKSSQPSSPPICLFALYTRLNMIDDLISQALAEEQQCIPAVVGGASGGACLSTPLAWVMQSVEVLKTQSMIWAKGRWRHMRIPALKELTVFDWTDVVSVKLLSFRWQNLHWVAYTKKDVVWDSRWLAIFQEFQGPKLGWARIREVSNTA